MDFKPIVKRTAQGHSPIKKQEPGQLGADSMSDTSKGDTTLKAAQK